MMLLLIIEFLVSRNEYKLQVQILHVSRTLFSQHYNLLVLEDMQN